MTNEKMTYEQLVEENRKLQKLLDQSKTTKAIERALNAHRLYGQLIIRENNETELFKQICKITVEEVGYKLAWIGIAKEDKSVLPVASAGFENNYLNNIRITWGDDEYSEGPTGQSIKTGEYVVMQDILNNPKFQPWKENAKKNKYKSSLAIPLFFNDKVFGSINIYSEEQNAFNKEEIIILQNAANDLSIGVSSIRQFEIIRNQKKELKKEKEKAEENELKLKLIADNFVNGMLYQVAMLDDQKRKFNYVSDAVKKLYNCTAEEVMQDPNLIYGKLHPDDIEIITKKEQEALKKMSIFRAEARIINPDGSIRWAYNVSKPRLIDGIPCWDGIELDITDRKNMELELLKAKGKAEESDKLKTAFLHNLSHEIRTPLNAIRGFSEILCKHSLTNEKRNSFASIIQNSSDQLISIVNDILAISSLETGQEKINIKPININSILVELLAIFKPKASNQNVSLYLKRQLPDNLAITETDETKLRQILSNLLTNALKFTKKGHVEFGYKVVENNLEFYVKDTGIGIPPELHEKIFERFRQAESSLSGNYSGTGLGLSISRGYVTLLCGKMWLKSEPNKGSTFYFTIPYEPVKEIETPNHTNIKPKILVAEDEVFNFLYIEELLINFDYQLIHAKDGKEAVDLAKTNHDLSLILMDIKMPVMDGHTAAKIIKAQNPNLPIVAQSAYALEHEIIKYSDIFNDYLIKPINGEILIEKVNKYVISK